MKKWPLTQQIAFSDFGECQNVKNKSLQGPLSIYLLRWNCIRHHFYVLSRVVYSHYSKSGTCRFFFIKLHDFDAGLVRSILWFFCLGAIIDRKLTNPKDCFVSQYGYLVVLVCVYLVLALSIYSNRNYSRYNGRNIGHCPALVEPNKTERLRDISLKKIGNGRPTWWCESGYQVICWCMDNKQGQPICYSFWVIVISSLQIYFWWVGISGVFEHYDTYCISGLNLLNLDRT